ncbi:uncharacterized protein LOC112126499 [Cimex lectularius]|uniref:Uncharacterized protein n=1 Tax=Cimex lectularius TaxID=79782 RepID=A0A8I6SGD1_CIMLE|nr:uncharacterized protein LOC112126499 [Cimex lectularius]
MEEDSGGKITVPPDINMVEEKKQVDFEIQHSKMEEYEKMEFNVKDPGPFQVILESKNSEGNGIARLHPMAIDRIIHEKCKEIGNNVTSIKKMSKNRIKVEFNNAISANKFLDARPIKEKNFNTYIPRHLLMRRGIIRNVCVDISDSELRDIIKDPYGKDLKIIDLKRLNRKSKDEKGKDCLIPTQSVLITVRGQYLPNYMIIHYVWCNIDPYNQRVIQCKKCFRYGHFADQCKGEVRCEKCGQSHDSSNCNSTEIRCIHCNLKHKANDFQSCPQFKKEKEIKQLMGEQNISYNEAKQKISGNTFATQLTKTVPCLKNFTEFPPIEKKDMPGRQYASTSSYKRTMKRSRFLSPPRQEITKQQIDPHNFYREATPKNEIGGLIKNNPHIDQRKNQINIDNDTKDTIFEATFSLVKKLQYEIKNKSTKETMDDNALKEAIRDRINNLMYSS